MDDPLPTTPVGGDTVNEEADDSTQLKWDPKDDGVVLAQLAIKGPVIPWLCLLRTLLLLTP